MLYTLIHIVERKRRYVVEYVQFDAMCVHKKENIYSDLTCTY